MNDSINRQAAIDAADRADYTELAIEDVKKVTDEVIKELKQLPSAERKRGEWIKMSDADGIYFACSICGENIPRIAYFDPQFDLFPRLTSIDKTNYCPNCGADLRGEANDCG